jgi:hypothetical protein
MARSEAAVVRPSRQRVESAKRSNRAAIRQRHSHPEAACDAPNFRAHRRRGHSGGFLLRPYRSGRARDAQASCRPARGLAQTTPSRCGGAVILFASGEKNARSTVVAERAWRFLMEDRTVTIHKRPRPPVRARRPAERAPLRSGLRRPPPAAPPVVTPKRPPPAPGDAAPVRPRRPGPRSGRGPRKP